MRVRRLITLVAVAGAIALAPAVAAVAGPDTNSDKGQTVAACPTLPRYITCFPVRAKG